MKYTSLSNMGMINLREDARKVAAGEFVTQRQDSLQDQLNDLYEIANRFGMYDAADYLRSGLQR